MKSQGLVHDVFSGKYDKSMHFSLSFVLTAIALVFLPVPTALLGVLGLGFAKEAIDTFTPGKHFDVWDLSVNILGIVAAYTLYEALLLLFL